MSVTMVGEYFLEGDAMERRGFLMATGASVFGLLAGGSSVLGRMLPEFMRPMPAKLCVWTGAVSADTSDPRNWRKGRLPFSGCDLTVNAGPALLIKEPINIRTLTVMANASVGFEVAAGLATCTMIDDIRDHENQPIPIG